MGHRILRHPIAGTCARCGEAFSGIAGRRYCSGRCMRLAAGKRARNARRAARVAAGLPLSGRTPGTCLVCGAGFVGHRDKRYCSRRCEQFAKARTREERERQLRKNRRYRELFPERVREQARRQREQSPNYLRTWRRKNREKVRASSERFRKRNPERYREHQRKHYWANREKRIAATRAWRKMNPDKHAHVQAARRARIARSEGTHTREEWLAVCAHWGYRCAYCDTLPARLTRDHIVPLKRGGTNDISNILPACPPCNCKKGTLTAAEFRARLLQAAIK